jgi:tRNA(fMet)-specific endonuclease VapC
MKYLLDTNTCIRIINQRSTSARAKFINTPKHEISISIIVVAELLYGAAKSQTPERSLYKQEQFIRSLTILNFARPSANSYAQIRALLEKQGKPIGGNDLLIAATALAHDLILVTHNTREFSRVPNLKLEDWETDN